MLCSLGSIGVLLAVVMRMRIRTPPLLLRLISVALLSGSCCLAFLPPSFQQPQQQLHSSAAIITPFGAVHDGRSGSIIGQRGSGVLPAVVMHAKKKKGGGGGRKEAAQGSSRGTTRTEEEEEEEEEVGFPSLITESEEAEAQAGVADGLPTAEEAGLSPTMYDKLRSEATTPFRSFRMFVYAGFGVGASLGGFTAITELIASLNNVPDAIPTSQAGVNVAVDVAVAGAAAYAWFFENRLKAESEKEMAALRAKEPYKLTFDIKAEREKGLSALPVTFTVGENQTLTWSVKEVRERGNQHLIVLAAPKQELSDALLSARLGKALFAKSDVMIAPYLIKDGKEEESESGSSTKGFGSNKQAVAFDAIFNKEAYVARPADEDAWKAYIEQELSDAVKQGNDQVRKQGIGVVMRKDGTIIRRGIGQPEWRNAVAELVGNKKPGENDDNYASSLPFAQQQKKKK